MMASDAARPALPFANGTEFMLFQEHGCFRGCQHLTYAGECGLQVLERSYDDQPTPEIVQEFAEDGTPYIPRCTCYEMTPGWKPARLTLRQALRRWWRESWARRLKPWKQRVGARLRENPRLCFVGVILWEDDICTWREAAQDWHSRVRAECCDRNCMECER